MDEKGEELSITLVILSEAKNLEERPS